MTRSERHEADSLIIELRKEGKSFEEIANLTNRRVGFVRTVCRDSLGITRVWTEEQRAKSRQILKSQIRKKRTDDEVKEKCSSIGYEYLGGYEGTEGYITIRCPICGTILKKKWNAVRKIARGEQKVFECEGCEKAKKEQKEKAGEKAKAERTSQREKRFWNRSFSQMSFKQCKKCGKLFYSTQKKYFCSEQCLKAVEYSKSKDKRLIKIKVAYKDYITLNELYKRNKGICYICGRRCNYSDCRTNESGAFIAGESYPSIDHIIPLSKGGLHSWENVGLAHRGCNTLKGNKIIVGNRPTP